MHGRERILRTFRFEQTDRPGVDLMEGHVWKELMAWFRAEHGFDGPEQVISYLDPDSRWAGLQWDGPPPAAPAGEAARKEPGETREAPVAEAPPLSKDVREGPLSTAATVKEVEAFVRGDPRRLVPRDYGALRALHPDKALVLCPGWMPLFWGACEAFGLEIALVHAHAEPALFEAFIQGQHTFYMDLLTRAAQAARGVCDICWLGDDYAGQTGMLISPETWRRLIKPYLAEQVRLLRENGLLVLLHSCGSVRPILPDLIDIGVNALLVFQTTASGMDPESIARDFGGRMAFYGGLDVQALLSRGTPADVEREVRRNAAAFSHCGGYVVANSHHGEPSINGANIVAMFDAARRIGAGNGSGSAAGVHTPVRGGG
jgi:uroporphyrinogen decarboxylase